MTAWLMSVLCWFYGHRPSLVPDSDGYRRCVVCDRRIPW